jgi:hypothetical protein
VQKNRSRALEDVFHHDVRGVRRLSQRRDRSVRSEARNADIRGLAEQRAARRDDIIHTLEQRDERPGRAQNNRILGPMWSEVEVLRLPALLKKRTRLAIADEPSGLR